MRALLTWRELPPLPWSVSQAVCVLAALSGGVRGGEDDDDGGGADEEGNEEGGDDGAEDKAKDKAKAKEAVEKARAETKAAKDLAAGLEKQITSLKATATKEQKEAVEALEKQLEEMNVSIKARDDDDKDRVESRLAKLPEASRAKLDAVKDDIPLAALEKLIDSEDAAPPPPKPDAKTPPGGGPDRDSDQDDVVPKNVMNALRRAGRKGAADALGGLEFVQGDGGNHNKWKMPMDMLMDDAEHRSRDRFSTEPPKGVALATKDIVMRGAQIQTKSKSPGRKSK